MLLEVYVCMHLALRVCMHRMPTWVRCGGTKVMRMDGRRGYNHSQVDRRRAQYRPDLSFDSFVPEM